VVAGFALGYLARYIYPPVQENIIPPREFIETLAKETSISDLPILPIDDDQFPVPTELP